MKKLGVEALKKLEAEKQKKRACEPHRDLRVPDADKGLLILEGVARDGRGCCENGPSDANVHVA